MELKSLNFLSKESRNSKFSVWWMKKMPPKAICKLAASDAPQILTLDTNSYGGNMRNTKMGPGAVRIVQIRAPQGAVFIQREHHQRHLSKEEITRMKRMDSKPRPPHAPTEIQFTNGVRIDLEDSSKSTHH